MYETQWWRSYNSVTQMKEEAGSPDAELGLMISPQKRELCFIKDPEEDW